MSWLGILNNILPAIVALEYLTYLAIGAMASAGWIRTDGDSRFSKIALRAKDNFTRFWQDARCYLVASLVIAGCLLVSVVVFLLTEYVLH